MSREIEVSKITEVIRDLCIKANTELGEDIIKAFKKATSEEESEQGKEILNMLIENAKIASESAVPICQDTGFAVIFLEIGQDIKFVGGSLEEAIIKGVSEGYTTGYLPEDDQLPS